MGRENKDWHCKCPICKTNFVINHNKSQYKIKTFDKNSYKYFCSIKCKKAFDEQRSKLKRKYSQYNN